MSNGVVMERFEGTPQGGPLSPLLCQRVAGRSGRELENAAIGSARYADDCNVYVRTRKAGERVLEGLRRLYAETPYI